MKLWKVKPLLRSPDAYIPAINTKRYLEGKKKILIVGDSGGRDWQYLNKHDKEIHVLDIAPQKDIPNCIIQTIEERTPYEDGFFDGVVLNDVLEHLFHDVQALEEVYRILKEDGVLVVAVPYFSNIQDRPYFHVRIHSPKTICRLLERCGFTIEEHFCRGLCSSLPSWGIHMRILIYVSHKIIEYCTRKTPDESVDIVNGTLEKFERFLGSSSLTIRIQKMFSSYGGIMKASKMKTKRNFNEIQIKHFEEAGASGECKINTITTAEKIKSVIRRVVYPPYTWFNNKYLRTKYKFNSTYDKYYYGQRGNDYDAHRRRVNRIYNVKDKVLLIVGCGAGKEVESWLKFKPKRIIAIDYFNYSPIWTLRTKYYYDKYKVEVVFTQADVRNLDIIPTGSVNIVSSDAVFEHLNDMAASIREIYRVLHVGGIIYATFGPLWHCWGGDHVSSHGGLKAGYNHLLLSASEYKEFLKNFGEYKDNTEDKRFWIFNNLFSYLKSEDYIYELKKHKFEKIFASIIIEPRAVKFKKLYVNEFRDLEKKHGEENLLITGLTLIYKKTIAR
jgi:ubiquinone/menaquinone biosynthesis C-methylase UbiE